jgi:antitoxin CcdA
MEGAMARARRRVQRGFSEDAGRKRATNVSLDRHLLEEARALNINISQAAEKGLTLQIAEERAKKWREENKEAIEGWNAYVEEHGLPLARYRQF